MDCSLPGFSVHGIAQARILEWVAISYSRRSYQPRDQTCISCIVGKFFYPCTTWTQDAAAAAAKSLQSCLTLCDPVDGSPPGSPVPGILQARTLEWVAISFSNAGYTSALLQMVKQMLGFYHTIWSQEGKHKHGS